MRLACSTVAISHVMHDAHTTLNLLRGISQILFFSLQFYLCSISILVCIYDNDIVLYIIY